MVSAAKRALGALVFCWLALAGPPAFAAAAASAAFASASAASSAAFAAAASSAAFFAAAFALMVGLSGTSILR